VPLTSVSPPAPPTLEQVAERYVTPAYLPDGARPRPTRVHRFSAGDRTVRSWIKEYALAGKVNADTVPPGPRKADSPLTGHLSTVLQIIFNPDVHVRKLPPGMPHYPDFKTEIIDLPSGPATLAWWPDGFGVQRIDWFDEAGYHVVMSERLKTTDGISGISRSELVRVARSLYE